MEQTSISNLNTKSTVDDNDYLVVDDLSSTNKILAKSILDTCKSELLAKLYPVGSIYMSVNSTSPATLFGGTWEQIKDTFLLGSGSYSLGSTGGEKSHTLTYAELPKQGFRVPHVAYYDDTSSNLGWSVSSRTAMEKEGAANSVSNNGWHNMTIGNSQAHNNMPPYLVVNIWKRTA